MDRINDSGWKERVQHLTVLEFIGESCKRKCKFYEMCINNVTIYQIKILEVIFWGEMDNAAAPKRNQRKIQLKTSSLSSITKQPKMLINCLIRKQ